MRKIDLYLVFRRKAKMKDVVSCLLLLTPSSKNFQDKLSLCLNFKFSLLFPMKALATFTAYPGYPAFSCLRSGVATLLEQNRSMQPQNVINSCVYFCLRQPWPIERCESNCKSAKLQGTSFKLIAKRVAYFG